MIQIVEKVLGIPGNYQYNALNNSVWPKRNWHSNKLVIVDTCLNLGKKLKVLDLGTGSGNFELQFSKKVKIINGVDYHNGAIAFLHSKLLEKGIKNVHLSLANIKKLPNAITKKRYDLITMVDVIEHLKYDEAKQVINRLSLLLEHGGKLFIITPNYTSVWKFLEIFLEHFHLVPKFTEKQHLTRFNPISLSRTIKSSKLKILNQGSFNLVSWLLPSRTLSHFFVRFERKILKNLGCLIYLVAQKNSNP